MVIFSLRPFKAHDSVSEYAAPYSSSFSSVSIYHFLAGFLPACDASHVALLIEFMDIDCAYACDHTKLKELNHKSLANAHFMCKFMKRFFCSDSNRIHMTVST